jgi:hypothetical protein
MANSAFTVSNQASCGVVESRWYDRPQGAGPNRKALSPRPSLPLPLLLLLLLLLLPPRQPTGPCDGGRRFFETALVCTGLATKQQRFEESTRIHIRIGIKLMNAKNDSAVGRETPVG